MKVHNIGTNLEQTSTSRNDGSFSVIDLPIGTYEITISKTGFKTEVYSQIFVRGNLTATVNATLQPGEITSTVTVTATPLMNQTDTTNGYVVDPATIQKTPLGTGSFTQLAILGRAYMRICSAAPARTPGSAIRPFSRMASATPATVFR